MIVSAVILKKDQYLADDKYKGLSSVEIVDDLSTEIILLCFLIPDPQQGQPALPTFFPAE